ncbi:MAG: hypothetical protein KJ732_02590 [Candidatus Margulisbacteria bacterium]|nr:hypothetical protein [Candidatus Margulisiibacteriota bacterium]
MSKMIMPIVTLMKRPAQILFRRGPTYLKGLTRLSDTIRDKLRERQTWREDNPRGVVSLSEFFKDFPQIAAILQARDLSEVDFTLTNTASFIREDLVKALISQAVRAAIRELATYGRPQTEQTGWLSSYDNYEKHLHCYLTMSLTTKAAVQVKIELYRLLTGPRIKYGSF